MVPALAAQRLAPKHALGLRRRNEIDGPLADAVRRTARVLGVPRPVLYGDEEQAEPLRLAAFATRRGVAFALVVGRPALRGRVHEADILFLVAETLACLRPERLARVVLPDPHALSTIASAARTLAREARVPAALDKLPVLVLEQIAAIGRQLGMRDVSARAALAWLRGAEGTAARAALSGQEPPGRRDPAYTLAFTSQNAWAASSSQSM